ncbi:hypothetical protein GBA52_020743 [Prunus armeniaca]|nr:hypothetical protein GBA52_020743 [Prunus armeniaca]
MKQVRERQGPVRRKTKGRQASAMDFEQTIIPGHLYQSWLQNSLDIVSRRGRKRKVCPWSLWLIRQSPILCSTGL